MFLKDLYVTEQARGLGIGRALLQAMARIAVDENYCRIDWTTDKKRQDGRLRLVLPDGCPFRAGGGRVRLVDSVPETAIRKALMEMQ